MLANANAASSKCSAPFILDPSACAGAGATSLRRRFLAAPAPQFATWPLGIATTLVFAIDALGVPATPTNASGVPFQLVPFASKLPNGCSLVFIPPATPMTVGTGSAVAAPFSAIGGAVAQLTVDSTDSALRSFRAALSRSVA